MMKAILIAIIAIASTRQACDKGCLKCNANSECLVADIYADYYLNGTTATASNLSNCSIGGHDGKCTVCDPKYYIDGTTGKCVAVATAALIANCDYYGSATGCIACAKDYFLNANACSAVETKISNCNYYAGTSTCSICASGYLSSLDNKSCVSAPSVTNCGDFSFVKCNTCASGYVLNPNNYIRTSIDLSIASNKHLLAEWAYYINDNIAGTMAQNACQTESTTGCAVYDQGTNTCTTCGDGRYIDNTAQCILFPAEPLENCRHYSAATTCSQCNDGFYLKSGVCTAVVPPANNFCATYNASATTQVCQVCQSNYYLSGSNCIERVNSKDNLITNCAAKDPSADRCLTCATNFILTTDGLQCVAVIANCSTHSAIIKDQKLSCTACASTFYISSINDANSTTTNECLPGTVANCSRYTDNSATQCNQCVNGFLLQNSVCNPHNTITGCTLYSTATLHTCSVCTDSTNYNFSIENICQSIPNDKLITQCATYSGSDLQNPVCDTCNTGYYKSGNTCAQAVANCNAMNGELCTGCKQGYALNHESKVCIVPFTNITDQCLENSTIDTNNAETVANVSCNVCKEHAAPFDFENHYICLSATETLQLSAGTTAIQTFCLKYDNDMKCTQCDVDSTNKFLDTTLTPDSCVVNCGDRPHFKYKMDEEGQILQLNTCYDIAVDGDNLDITVASLVGCDVFASDLTGDFDDYICLKCKSGYAPVTSFAQSRYSNVNPDATNLASFFASAFARYPSVTCVAINNTNTFGANAQLLDNCAYYFQQDDTVFFCLRCRHKYTGTITGANNYISACIEDTGCATEVQYNLHPYINNIASCHKCANTSQIPFIAFNTDTESDNDTYYQFISFAAYNSAKTGNVFANANGTQKNIVCRANSQATFGIPADDYKVDANCGIGVLHINTNGVSNNTSTFGSYCAACKPGFTATPHADLPHIQLSCTAIAQCAATSTYFNACSTCNNGYIHKYLVAANATNVKHDTCLQIDTALANKLANCYAAEADANTATKAGECKVCKTGYSLNADGYCESFTPANCAAGSFRFRNEFDSDDWNWSIWVNGNGVGCNKCSNSFVAVKVAASRKVCLNSIWVTSNVDSIARSNANYIPNCKYYDADIYDNGRKCNTCDTNYVLHSSGDDLDRTKCYINTSIANCKYATSATVCIECISSAYSLRNNKCETGAIANCAAYNFDENNTSVKCTQCNPDFYLDTTNNACVLGRIHNCRVLTNNDGTGCSACQDNYARLVDNNNKGYYCYPQDVALGCGAMVFTTNAYPHTVTCNTCANTATQIPAAPLAAANKTVCMAFAPITNCQSYDVLEDVTRPLFTCSNCNPAFYLSNNRCVARINQPAKCIAYSPVDDICTSCDNTSYLSNSNRACTDYPKGILGCRTYSSATTCTACTSGRYLSANTCPRVTTAITNCTFYSANNVCSTCEKGYVLINNTCVKATAANCATYTSETVCATCEAGSALETTANVTNCVVKSKTGCATIDINSPYNCLACSGNYYLDAGECKNPTTITNCAAYSAQTTCSRCNAGYALSVDKTACVNSLPTASYIDGNCSDSQIVSTAVCSRCDTGFYFVNGACTGSCNSSTASGCLACNPKTPTVCYICETGFWQNKDGKCNEIATDTSNVMITRVLSVLIAVISLMF